jgi:hypothetical protein
MAEFFDFDQAVGEMEPRLFDFLYENKKYTIDLNVDAGKLLMWMEHADSIKALPHLLRAFLSEEQFEQIMGSGAKWPKLELLVTKLAEELGSGGSGN